MSTKDTMEYLGAAKRFIRAAGARCADADDFELAELLTLQDELDAAVATAVAGVRARGMSWAYIAGATGTSRQAAYQRWGKTDQATA